MARAGNDVMIVLPVDHVVLYGNGSTDDKVHVQNRRDFYRCCCPTKNPLCRHFLPGCICLPLSNSLDLKHFYVTVLGYCEL